MVFVKLEAEGIQEVGARINQIIKNIENEPGKTLTRMANDGLLFAIMQAPRRTGALASNIVIRGNKNTRQLAQRPVAGAPQPNYPMWIDMGVVRTDWGTNKENPRMIDKRDPMDKLYYFVGLGDGGHKGKTLSFLESRFPTEVKRLGERIIIR